MKLEGIWEKYFTFWDQIMQIPFTLIDALNKSYLILYIIWRMLLHIGLIVISSLIMTDDDSSDSAFPIGLTFILLTVLFSFIMILFIYRNNKPKKAENEGEQNEEAQIPNERRRAEKNEGFRIDKLFWPYLGLGFLELILSTVMLGVNTDISGSIFLSFLIMYIVTYVTDPLGIWIIGLCFLIITGVFFLLFYFCFLLCCQKHHNKTELKKQNEDENVEYRSVEQRNQGYF
jgi:phosphotransferase system  glucose/maltose/N-acetylglucosamine-specific IIC component